MPNFLCFSATIIFSCYCFFCFRFYIFSNVSKMWVFSNFNVMYEFFAGLCFTKNLKILRYDHTLNAYNLFICTTLNTLILLSYNNINQMCSIKLVLSGVLDLSKTCKTFFYAYKITSCYLVQVLNQISIYYLSSNPNILFCSCVLNYCSKL